MTRSAPPSCSVDSPESSAPTSVTPVIHAAPINSATPGPVLPALVSAACFPQIVDAPVF